MKLFFTSLFTILISCSCFAQSGQEQKATQQIETIKSDSVIKDEKKLLPLAPIGAYKYENPNNTRVREPEKIDTNEPNRIDVPK